MKKPTPPKKDTAPQSLFPPPQPSKHLRFEDDDPTVKPLDPPKYSRGNSSGSKILCDTCAKCWRMDIAGQFQNKKADGTDFVLVERYCRYNERDMLSLAERHVVQCNLFSPVKEN